MLIQRILSVGEYVMISEGESASEGLECEPNNIEVFVTRRDY